MRAWLRKNDVRLYLRMNVSIVVVECESMVEDECESIVEDE